MNPHPATPFIEDPF